MAAAVIGEMRIHPWSGDGTTNVSPRRGETVNSSSPEDDASQGHDPKWRSDRGAEGPRMAEVAPLELFEHS